MTHDVAAFVLTLPDRFRHPVMLAFRQPHTRVGTGGRGGGHREARKAQRPRSTFASNALAAGLTVYELARVMGTSVRMIELHYGALLDTAHASLLQRLEAFGAQVGHAVEVSTTNRRG